MQAIQQRKQVNTRNESQLRSSQPFSDDARARKGFSIASGCWYQLTTSQTGKLLTSLLQLPPIVFLAEQMAQPANSNCETEPQYRWISDSGRIEPAFCPRSNLSALKRVSKAMRKLDRATVRVLVTSPKLHLSGINCLRMRCRRKLCWGS